MEVLTQLSSLNPLASTTALTAWAWAGDFFVILILFGILFFLAWYMGRGSFMALLVSLYAGYALYRAFPYFSYVPTSPPLAVLGASLGIYLVLTGIVFLILQRAVVSDFVYIGWFGLAILSLLGAGFLLALAYHLFPIAPVYTFTPAIDMLFAPQEYFFWWFIAPLVGLFIFAR